MRAALVTLAKHVVSLPLALRMKAAGFAQKTEYSWCLDGGPKRGKWEAWHNGEWESEANEGFEHGHRKCAAPLASEVMEVLPTNTKVSQRGGYFASHLESHLGEEDSTMANALALLWLALNEKDNPASAASDPRTG